MAGTDGERLNALLEGFTKGENAALDSLIGELSKSATILNFAPATKDEQGRLDETVKIKCPECGNEFNR